MLVARFLKDRVAVTLSSLDGLAQGLPHLHAVDLLRTAIVPATGVLTVTSSCERNGLTMRPLEAAEARERVVLVLGGPG